MKNNLLPIANELTTLYAAQVDGEQFHEDYKKNKEIFRKIVASDVKLEKRLTSYFKTLSKKVRDEMDWYTYNRRVANIVDDMVTVDWNDEELAVKVLLTDSLIQAINAGGELTQLDTLIDIGWTSKEPAMIEFLNKYTLKLAGNLTNTTRDTIKQALITSLQNKELQADATERIMGIIDNPVRAKAIAHTESIRAFSAGRLEVARQVGAQGKEWSAVGGACPICAPLDGQVVALDKSFSGGPFVPPAHPNCRCIIRIVMGDQAQTNDFDLLDSWSDYPFN
jgi:SPP1 gp7 family putative phage head morphogenesis protein